MVKTDDRTLAKEALVGLRRRPTRLTLPNGESVRIPLAAVDGLISMLEALANGDVAQVVRSPAEVTTQKAADILNVSRPTVVRLIDEGTLKARKVGTHRRVLVSELLAYRDIEIKRRRTILDEMARDAEDLGLYGPEI
jgi:excisionase family DNA binding protein